MSQKTACYKQQICCMELEYIVQVYVIKCISLFQWIQNAFYWIHLCSCTVSWLQLWESAGIHSRFLPWTSSGLIWSWYQQKLALKLDIKMEFNQSAVQCILSNFKEKLPFGIHKLSHAKHSVQHTFKQRTEKQQRCPKSLSDSVLSRKKERKSLQKQAVPLTRLLVTQGHNVQPQQNKASNDTRKLEPIYLLALMIRSKN